MPIELVKAQFGYYRIVDTRDGGEEALYISDWDRPSLASMFGWEPCPFCRETDGTIDCKHRTASAMILSATNYLDNHDGEISDHYSIENGILS